jgi:hypothetical protein
MLIDSVMAYPWSVASLITIHTFLQDMLNRLAHRMQLNPPLDDIQYCWFLIRAISFFFFYPGTMTAMLNAI